MTTTTPTTAEPNLNRAEAWLTRQEAKDILTRAGHSAAKALEIALDYERGDIHAVRWIDQLVEREKARKTEG